jgi:hypothetical protein
MSRYLAAFSSNPHILTARQVRLASAASMPVFVRSLAAATPSEAMALARLAVPALVDAVGIEPDIPALLLLVECVAELVDAAPLPLVGATLWSSGNGF